MISRLIAFLVILVIFFIVFSKVNFKQLESTTIVKPNLVLENSHVKHYQQGVLKYTVFARSIEIYSHKFILHDGLINFINGPEIQSVYMEADTKRSELLAKKNVLVLFDNFQFSGNEIKYFIKEKRFIGYNGGKIIIDN